MTLGGRTVTTKGHAPFHVVFTLDCFKTLIVISILIYLYFIIPFQHGADDVKRHRWFKNIIWEDVYYKKVQVCMTQHVIVGNY